MTYVRTQSRPSMPDTDLFTVARSARDQATLFQVAHYPSRAATSTCCQVEILQEPGESDSHALARAADAIAATHRTDPR